MITTESLKDTVLDAAKDVFESMVSTSLEESSLAAEPGDMAFLASITFRGGVEGCLSVHCDPACARAIAAGSSKPASVKGPSASRFLSRSGSRTRPNCRCSIARTYRKP